MLSLDRQLELITQLSEIVEELGWQIAMDSETEIVTGLIIGDEEFISNVAGNIESIDFDLMTFDGKKDKKEVH